MAGYIGNIPVPQALRNYDVFTATAGQTSFPTSGYTPGFLDVYLNGVHLVNGSDYTASNGSDVVLSSGATVGDRVEIITFTTFEAGATGGGYYIGERGTIGAASGTGDIFRGHQQTLNTDVTLTTGNNWLCAGTLTVASGVTLTVESGARLVVV